MNTTLQPRLSRTIDARRSARDRLIEEHLGLAISVAREFAGQGEELDDLRQVALLALVQAADRYDPALGWKFSTFAVPTLRGTLKRHFRDRSWAIRPPRQLQERYMEAVAIVEALTNELRRSPTTSEIAARGGWSEAEATEALSQHAYRTCDHTDAYNDSTDYRFGFVETGFDAFDVRDQRDRMLAKLSARDRRMVILRTDGDLPQTEIARRVGLSQMHVSRRLRLSAEMMRSA